MPGDEVDEIQAPALPRYSSDSKVPATFHDGTEPDCECLGYVGTVVCGCWRRRATGRTE